MNHILSRKTAWRVHDHGHSGVLVDGRDYFLAFHEAARSATRSILLLGWQFDSDVQLVRGSDLPPRAAPEAFELLPFLDGLCRERPGLEIRVLAWDHSLVFTLEREVLQKLVFDVATCPRFHFQWDGTVRLGGSHHQKVAIVDGRVAFAGSQDLCQSRWDTSSHLAFDPRRTARFGVAYKPYHEVQAVLTGAPVRSLVELFCERWRYATGEALDPDALVAARHGPDADAVVRHATVPIGRSRVALARTIPGDHAREPVHEVRDLLVAAIRRAERFVYIETQYLTSCAVRDALVERMTDARRGPLDVVIVLPRKPERFKEEFTVGLPQAQLLWTLAETARKHGHRLGAYNVAAPDGDEDTFVYVHSKTVIVDDTFMTIGSANLTNRSMTIDSELNVVWEAGPDDDVKKAIRRVRVRLLLEHLGEAAALRVALPPTNLVTRLEQTIDAGTGRLRRHDVHREEPSVLAKAMQELACEYLDPTDGAEVLGAA